MIVFKYHWGYKKYQKEHKKEIQKWWNISIVLIGLSGI